jgi:tRNA(fMet)-specific endonuclease VapC
MPNYVLDTDTVTLQQANRATILRQLERIPPTQVFTTVITLREQIRGRLAVIDRLEEDAILVHAYTQLQVTMNYFKQVPVLPFTGDALAQLQQLRRQKVCVGTQDLRIAAIVLSVDSILVTSNRRDFMKVPGLRIEDWNVF